MDSPLRSRAPLTSIAILSFVMMGYSSPACNDLLYVEPGAPNVQQVLINAELDLHPNAPVSESGSYTWFVARESMGKWQPDWQRFTTGGGNRSVHFEVGYVSPTQVTRGVVIVSYQDGRGDTWGGTTEIFDWPPDDVQLRIDAIVPCEHEDCVPELLPSGP